MKYKVVSLNPPYGTLIAACERFPNLGKHIETRGRWDYEHRGPLLIHQTRGLGDMFDSEEELRAFRDQEPFRTTLAAMGYRDASELPRGEIVAVVNLTAVHRIPVTPMHFPWCVADSHPLASFPVVHHRSRAATSAPLGTTRRVARRCCWPTFTS